MSLDPVHALIAMMTVTWLISAAMLVMLWREVRAMSATVEEQRDLLELRMMRTRMRRQSPQLDPVVLEAARSGDGDPTPEEGNGDPGEGRGPVAGNGADGNGDGAPRR